MFCIGVLTASVSGATIEFDYGFKSNEVAAGAGPKPYNPIPIPVTASTFACNMTIKYPGLCGAEREPACPTMTSDFVSMTVLCKFL